MKRAATILAVLSLALIASTANAATINDLTTLGYTVSISSQLPGPNGTLCNIYYISGHGVATYANACDPGYQTQIDSYANPAAICNADWQHNHPDQLAAFQTIVGLGWNISGDQCADTYTVTNPNDGTVAYSGSGAGLPALATTIGAPPVAATTGTSSVPTNGTTTTTTTTSGGACLPLCSSPGDTRGAGGAVTPAPTGTTTTTTTATPTASPTSSSTSTSTTDTTSGALTGGMLRAGTMTAV